VNSFLVPAAVVAVAEIGNKTQLLPLVLAAKSRKRSQLSSVFWAATLANRAAAAAMARGSFG
jgi:Ca2+/H+ antiporter, TMEM165/GDT1 family